MVPPNTSRGRIHYRIHDNVRFFFPLIFIIFFLSFIYLLYPYSIIRLISTGASWRGSKSCEDYIRWAVYLLRSSLSAGATILDSDRENAYRIQRFTCIHTINGFLYFELE